MCVPLSCLWVIRMAIVRSGWVQQPQIVMVLQPWSRKVSGCDQLVVGPAHAPVGTHDLLTTEFPDLARVAVVAPIDNSDHSSLLAVILMAQAVQTFVTGRKFSLNVKSVEIQFVVKCSICPDVTFGLLTILLRSWMSICCCWLDVMFQPRSSVCATRLRGCITKIKQSYIIHLREKRFKHKIIIMSCQEKFVSRLFW